MRLFADVAMCHHLNFFSDMRAEKSLLSDSIFELLEDSDLVRKMPLDEVRTATRYFGINILDPGAVIFREGDKGAFLCVVGSGAVTVKKSNLDGKTVTLATLRKGRVFGEMALLDGEWRSATCIATDDTVLLTLSQESLDKMVEEAPKIAVHIMRAIAIGLSRRLRMADGKLVDCSDEEES